VRPSANDRPGNAPGETLFAVGVYRVGQLALPRASDQLGCRVARAGIHAHVERFVPLKAETSARRIELHRGDAQIGEGPGHLAYTPRIENVVERPVVRVDQIDTIGPGCESDPSRRQGVLIAIETDEARRAGLEKRSRMTAEPDGAIDK